MPKRLYGTGDSITTALEHIYNYSFEDILFCSHISHVLIGEKAADTPFKIGIQKPFADRSETIAVMEIADKSVVSSGVYERYFEQDGKLYHHILDSKTGYPCDNGLISVTIISDRSVDGDALSTSCFALGLEKGREYLESLGSVQGVFITEDYEIHYTEGFHDVIRVSDEQDK